MFKCPLKNSLTTVAAVCDRRISAQIYASALTERRYKPVFQRAVDRSWFFTRLAYFLRACFENRPVRGPGLQGCRNPIVSCRPRALTRRFGGFLKHALCTAMKAMITQHCDYDNRISGRGQKPKSLFVKGSVLHFGQLARRQGVVDAHAATWLCQLRRCQRGARGRAAAPGAGRGAHRDRAQPGLALNVFRLRELQRLQTGSRSINQHQGRGLLRLLYHVLKLALARIRLLEIGGHLRQ